MGALATLENEELAKSGMVSARRASARAGYSPVPLEQVPINALKEIPIYLNSGKTAGDRFTLYCGGAARFTENHRTRLRDVGVRFIYLPMECQEKFRRQVEHELETMAADPEVATVIKSALMYETSIELINEVLTEQGVAKNLPRLESVSRSVSTLVMNDVKAFSHLFALSQHDFYTATHMVNVGTWMTSLAYALGITDPAELGMICMAGMVHDVGKMFVPSEILNKVGSLEAREWDALKAHPVRGMSHLKSEGVGNEIVLRVTGEHHERMDGTGYPFRYNSKQIHRASQICSVIDSFDAMTSCRPFKNKVKSIAEAVEVLKSEAPDKYDPDIVEAWVKLLKKASADGAFQQPVEKPDSGMGRRRFERFSIDCPVRLHVLRQAGKNWTEGPAIAAKSHNMSNGGIGILVNQPLLVSDYVRVSLNGKGSLNDRTIEGLVARCRGYSDGWYEVGIKFCNPSQQEQATNLVLEERQRENQNTST